MGRQARILAAIVATLAAILPALGAAEDGRFYDYLIVAHSLSAGEGPWGFGLDEGGNPVVR